MRATLPWPQLLNARTRVAPNHGGVYTTKSDKSFKTTVATMLAAAQVAPFTGAVVLSMWCYRPNNRSDWDAPIKAISDVLEGYAYRNDSQVIEGHVYKLLDRDRPRVEVEFTPAQQRVLELPRIEPNEVPDGRPTVVYVSGKALNVASNRLRPAVTRPGERR